MKFSSQPHRASLFASLLLCVLAAVSVNGQSQSTARGRVVYKDNGQPLKGVTVMVLTANADERVRAVTNERGEFQLTGLGAGKYYITVQGPGIPSPSGFGMTIPLPVAAIPRAQDFPDIVPKHDAEFSVDGTNDAEVEVRVLRGGSVSGKVMKADGSPVANVSINLLSRENNVGPYTARFSGSTNQKGVYKIDNVPPAEYLVSATIYDARVADVRAQLRGEGQIVTFHPAAVRLTDALKVRVDAGRESGGVNVTLVERKSLNISGKLVAGGDGSPIAGATIVLRPGDADMTGPLVPGMGQRTTTTSSDGAWSFSNVMAGDYEVVALNPIGGAPAATGMERRTPSGPGGRPVLGSHTPPDLSRARPRYSIVQENISVVSSDVENLTLTLRGSARLRGVVETDSGEPLPRNLTLFFEFSERGRPTRPVPVHVSSDGSFVLEDVPAGDRTIAAALPSGSDYFVISAESGGKDIREGISLVEGTEGAPIRVQISNKYAQVSGRVTPAESGIVVLFFPVESTKQRFRTAYTAILAGSDGSFAGKVPPGEYFILARRREQLPALITQEFIESLGNSARRVVLSAGEQKALEVQLSVP